RFSSFINGMNDGRYFHEIRACTCYNCYLHLLIYLSLNLKRQASLFLCEQKYGFLSNLFVLLQNKKEINANIRSNT
ncbi:MAG: hypothetical protein M0P00_09010, partial [Bacteroidaceae bacterium]|nr:hypothetical protein [Bacteroidaceae bacterium]